MDMNWVNGYELGWKAGYGHKAKQTDVAVKLQKGYDEGYRDGRRTPRNVAEDIAGASDKAMKSFNKVKINKPSNNWLASFDVKAKR
jgi:hypothetical protein